MKRKQIISIVAVIAIIAIVVIKLKSNKQKSQAKIYQYNKEQPVAVQTDTLQIEGNDAYTTFSGIFEPNKETKISAEIQGKINEVFVDLGSPVKKGQMLVQIDNALLQLQMQSIDVQIEGLEADLKRYKILTQADAIQAVQLEKTELALKTAKLQKATLQEQINKTAIKSPFDGIVAAKLTETGAFAAPGVPLLQITDINTLKFTVNVAENDINHFVLNQDYKVEADVYPDLFFTAKLTAIGSKANMGNSFPVQFTLKNTADLKIKAGMFGKVYLKENKDIKGIFVPLSAIINNAGQTQVYLVKNGTVSLQTIVIEKRIQNKALIKQGLKAGDVIVTKGFINLFEGASIN